MWRVLIRRIRLSLVIYKVSRHDITLTSTVMRPTKKGASSRKMVIKTTIRS